MSYRIQYGAGPVEFEHQRKKKSPMVVFMLSVVIIILCASYFWPERMDAFRRELFPFLYEPGKSAIVAFAQEIDSKGSFSSAMEAFCAELMVAR